MILLSSAVRIYVAVEPVNMRRAFDSLMAQVRSVLAQDPLSGHVFAFVNRRRNQVKLLMWTRGGFTIIHNQLYSCCTSFGSRSMSCSPACWVRMAAARSTSGSHRLQCFLGSFFGSS